MPLLIVIALLAIPHSSNAENLDDVVNRSDVIAVVHIWAGTHRPRDEIDNGCGLAYESFVETGLKNAYAGQIINFRSDLLLDLAETYLVFLTNDTAVPPRPESNARLDIASKECAESGILFTPVEYLRTESFVGGPAIVLQRWLVRNSDDQENDRRVEYFLGSPMLEYLFRYDHRSGEEILPPISVEIERPRHTSKRSAYRADALMKLLAKP